MKILIAEDERVSRRSLERQLIQWGHDVSCAEDGVDAWNRFQNDEFQIVISDWDMPNMNGPELIEHVRADERPSYVYVIMLTARGGKDDLVRGMEAGADDFLTKPFDKNELRVRLRAGERVIRLERTLASNNALLKSANDRMNRDLNAAAQVQQSIMPDRSPEIPSVLSGWRYCPCDELAGDALSVFALDDRYLCGYVLDVSGHGVPAALLSVAIARSLWLSDDPTSVVLKGTDTSHFGRFASPATVMTRLNQHFPFAANGDRFFTMIYSLLDVHTGELTFCCAGHPGPIRVNRDHSVDAFETSSHIVGIIPDPEYTDETLDLKPGDRVYFYSDGVPEQFSASKEHFGETRFANVLRRGHDLSLQDCIDSGVGELAKWAGTHDFNDDVSILGYEWVGR